MMNAAKWVGGTHPRKWAFKKDMPVQFRREACRVDFGLYGVAWIARDHENGVLMDSGQRMPTLEFYLCTPGHVIGPRDMQVVSHWDWIYEWQTACGERMMDAFNLHVTTGGQH